MKTNNKTKSDVIDTTQRKIQTAVTNIDGKLTFKDVALTEPEPASRKRTPTA